MVLMIGCKSSSPSSTSVDTWEVVSLKIERAVFIGATERVKQCEVCREDFQSTYDILDYMLDDSFTRQDLVAGLSWMKLDKMGEVILTEEDIFVDGHSLSDEFLYCAANAFWVGLNKYLNPTPKNEN